MPFLLQHLYLLKLSDRKLRESGADRGGAGGGSEPFREIKSGAEALAMFRGR